MSQPLLNQKQAWPLLPVRWRGSAGCAETVCDGDSHQFGLSNGIGYAGTARGTTSVCDSHGVR
jgi:hypothetical protein